MKKLIIVYLATTSLNLSILCVDPTLHPIMVTKPMPSQKVFVKNNNAEHTLSLHNNSGKPVSISIFKPNESEAIGYFGIGINAGETKEIKIDKLYWFEKKGLGFGQNKGPIEALMQSYPTQISVKAGSLEPKTENLYEGPYNQINVSINENGELQIDHPMV